MKEARFLKPNEVDCPKCGSKAGEWCLMQTNHGTHSVRASKARYDSTCTSEWTITVGDKYEGSEYTHMCDLPLGHASLHASTTNWTNEEAAQ